VQNPLTTTVIKTTRFALKSRRWASAQTEGDRQTGLLCSSPDELPTRAVLLPKPSMSAADPIAAFSAAKRWHLPETFHRQNPAVREMPVFEGLLRYRK
jgi:hypothetical protein